MQWDQKKYPLARVAKSKWALFYRDLLQPIESFGRWVLGIIMVNLP